MLDDDKYNVVSVIRVLAGVVSGVPTGFALAELLRGWRQRAARQTPPPFAEELADAPRQPGEWL